MKKMTLGTKWEMLHLGNIKPKKIVNLIKRLIFYKRRTRLNYYPLSYTIDPSSVCNLKCPYCMHGYYDPEIYLKKDMMRYEDFITILNKIKDYALILHLYNYGEPLLNPDIHKMIKAATDAGVRCRISSNLSMNLTDEMAENIVKSGLYRLSCAIDGPTQEVYQEYRHNGDISKVIENAKKIVYFKKKLKSKTPILAYRMLVFEWNHEYIEMSRQLSNEIGFDEFLIERGHYTLNNEKVLWDIENAKWEVFEKRRDPAWSNRKAVVPCHWIFNSMVIGSNGKSLVCCTNELKRCEHMSLLEYSLEEVWNSKEYIETRAVSMGLKQERETVLETCKYCKDL